MSASSPPAGPAGRRRSRAARWAAGTAVAAMAAIGLVLMFLLAQATRNRELYERNYALLFSLNVVVAALLVAVILWIAIRLALRLRRGKFGSRLLVKLAAIFALVGVVPGVLIYVVSYQFVSRSIESWFDVKVEGALDAGLSLGRATLDTLANDLSNQTRAASGQLGGVPDTSAGLMLERIRDQLAASDVVLWSAGGRQIASAGQSRFQLNPERPSQQQLRSARSQGAVSQIEGLDDAATGATGRARIKVLALVSAPGFGLFVEPRYLQVTQALPPTLVANALAVQEAYSEYQERALGREGLRRMYIGTLTLSLFLAVFGAVLLAVLLGNQLARPLLLLAEGVRQVAAGDLRPKVALQGRDELGGLTRSFAEMTRQLADARAAALHSMAQLDAARANLQAILDNLTAGVIVLDAQGLILSSNPGATRILRAPLAAFEGRLLAAIPGLEAFAASVLAQFESFQGERQQHGLDHWQKSFELHASGGSGPQADVITLVARGAALPDDTRLLVFDDISEIVSAQRVQAWGEVARRLAHEIKNPLTPIQLSAERLEMKLSGKVAQPEQAVLAKSVKTIVDQVEAMKRLVNEFRDYARLPAAELKPLDLNALVSDVLQLYGGESGEAGGGVAVRAELDPLCPRILGDAQQLRQVVHNLLQNAQDATEAVAGHGEAPFVLVRTQWVEASRRVRLSVLDQGHGFPEPILKRAFEPYVTTKARGTGLGLAVVKKIADEHRARVDISNRVVDGQVRGAQVSLSFAMDDTTAAAA
ncbi:ATP-binding protein [Ramlibacter sp. 2FC]|uniref:sensor histidine kinase n=1 Tax=Ramlibacter sp. 2FC TaxID=2502188 RepID=UPI00201DD093|nr:ATP-binding protein [Ramlibacter sp. 2FC]